MLEDPLSLGAAQINLVYVRSKYEGKQLYKDYVRILQYLNEIFVNTQGYFSFKMDLQLRTKY